MSDVNSAEPSGEKGALSGNPGDYSFLYNLTSAPCFRESSMYAIGGGGVIGALNFYRNRDAMRAAEVMVKSGCGIALLNWFACRQKFYAEREATYGSLEMLRRKQATAAVARAKQMREEQE